ncbi:MAG: hypothetical protein SF339_13230 [Blastocatellia bacterium]|nr:hypothetical protein [Blastocatellia bacterium]
MIEWVARLAAIYVLLGIAFGVAFALIGAGRLDPAAREAGWGFRVLILPAAAGLWPILLLRWIRGQAEPPAERNPHRDAARKGEA